MTAGELRAATAKVPATAPVVVRLADGTRVPLAAARPEGTTAKKPDGGQVPVHAELVLHPAAGGGGA